MILEELTYSEAHTITLAPHGADADLIESFDAGSRTIRTLTSSEYLDIKNSCFDLLGVGEVVDNPVRRRIELKIGGRVTTIRIWILPSRPVTISLSLTDRNEWISRRQVQLDTTLLDEIERLGSHRRGLILISSPSASVCRHTLAGILSSLKQRGLRSALFQRESSSPIRGITTFDLSRDDSARILTQENLLYVTESGVDVLALDLDLDQAQILELIPLAAVEALVIVTMGSRDAIGAAQKLTQLKASPEIVNTTLEMVVAIHRAERLCPFCRKPEVLDEKRLPQVLKGSKISNAMVFRADGCTFCDNSGTRGGVNIYEVLNWDREKTSASLLGLSKKSLIKKSFELGLMRPVSLEARRALFDGVISFEEYLRLLGLKPREPSETGT